MKRNYIFLGIVLITGGIGELCAKVSFDTVYVILDRENKSSEVNTEIKVRYRVNDVQGTQIEHGSLEHESIKLALVKDAQGKFPIIEIFKEYVHSMNEDVVYTYTPTGNTQVVLLETLFYPHGGEIAVTKKSLRFIPGGTGSFKIIGQENRALPDIKKPLRQARPITSLGKPLTTAITPLKKRGILQRAQVPVTIRNIVIGSKEGAREFDLNYSLQYKVLNPRGEVSEWGVLTDGEVISLPKDASGFSTLKIMRVYDVAAGKSEGVPVYTYTPSDTKPVTLEVSHDVGQRRVNVTPHK
jgi:hypothetical protein